MSFPGIPNHANEDKVKQNFVLFTLGNHLKVKNFGIYLSHNSKRDSKRHYHIQLNKTRQRNKNCKGKFKPSLGETKFIAVQKTKA